jgi:hypothetical protein
VNTNQEPGAPYPTYIKILPHPHSTNTDEIIIPVDCGEAALDATQKPTETVLDPIPKPWAPFRTRADFEYTETAVQGLLSKGLVDRQLSGITKCWSVSGSHLTIRNYADMERSLEAARQYGVPVRDSFAAAFKLNFTKIHSSIKFIPGHVIVPYQGSEHRFDFEYRDPWRWITTLVTDESLAAASTYNSVKKFFCEGIRAERLWDEPNTADTWWEIDVRVALDQFVFYQP